MWIDFLINLCWMIFGYLIGSINFSIILTKFSKTKENIKSVGSKNAGATNALRTYGWKFGFLIFLLDASKSYWFAFLISMLQLNFSVFNSLIPQLAIIFVIVGHIFPIYFNFQGGKGAACLLGMIASINLFLAIIGTFIFLLVVYFTKYVSLGSIVVPYILALLALIPGLHGGISGLINWGPFWLSSLMLIIASMIVTASHYKNIINLIQHNERKISLRKTSTESNQK